MSELLDMVKEHDRDSQLHNPVNRAVIKAYSDAETYKLDEAVYKPLENRYPSLRNLIESMREKEDPVEKIDHIKSMMGLFEVIRFVSDLSDVFYAFGEMISSKAKRDADKEHAEVSDKKDDDYKECEKVISNLEGNLEKNFEEAERVMDMFNKVIPIREQFYVDIANAIREVGSKNNLTFLQVIYNNEYMDEATRIVFPERKYAEMYFKFRNVSNREMEGLMRTFSASIHDLDISAVLNELGSDEKTAPYVARLKELSEDAKKHVSEAKKSMPTKKAMDILEAAVLEYKTREFDRIYAQVQ